MGALDDAEQVEPATIEDWAAWLAEHHATSTGVWLVAAKKSSGRQAFDYEDSIVEALRYGWVDATARGLDETRSMLWFSPRRPTSGWARSNKIRIERLEREGRLEAAGRAAIEVAKANGTWTMLDDVEDLVVPADLGAAFDARPGSREAWDGFSRSARKAMLTWVVQAKKPETRERRINEIAEKAGQGLKARS